MSGLPSPPFPDGSVIDVLCRAEADVAVSSELGMDDPRCSEIMRGRVDVIHLIEALIGCVEHMEHSTRQGREAYVAARAVLVRVGAVS